MNMVASVIGVGGKMPDAFADIVEEHWPTSTGAAHRAAAEAKAGENKKNNNNKRKKEAGPTEPAGGIIAVSLSALVDSINHAKDAISFSCWSVTSKEVRVLAQRVPLAGTVLSGLGVDGADVGILLGESSAPS